MSSVMNRSFADFMGFKWPPGVAYYVNGEPVTYEHLGAVKRERQRDRLKRILEIREPRRAVKISVRYFDQFIYGGWHAYVDMVGRDSIWVRPGHYLTSKLLQAFPLVPRSEDHRGKDFYSWLPVFAETFRRDLFDGKSRGVVYCWALTSGDHIDDFVVRPDPHQCPLVSISG